MNRSVAIPNLKHSEKGAGLVELLIASLLLTSMAIAIGAYFNETYVQGKKLNSIAGCNEYASSVVQAIKAMDNSLNIRNWLPPDADHRKVGPLAEDTLCNPNNSSENKRSASCDSVDLFEGDGSFSAGTVLNNNLHIRNGATWANNLTNSFPGEICNTDTNGVPGKLFARAELAGLFPNDTEFKTDLYLSIQEGKSAACGAPIVSRPNDGTMYKIRVTVPYIEPGSNITKFCKAETGVAYAADRVSPTTTVVARGLSPAPYFCTCNRSWGSGSEDLPANPCDERLSATVDFESSEPGSLFACALSSSWGVGATPDRYCGAPAILGASMANIEPGISTREPAAVSSSRNKPTAGRMSLMGLVEGTSYELAVKSIDSAGNFAASPVTVRFQAKKGQCPDPNSYCANEQPPDGCGNSCVPGNIQVPSCPGGCGQPPQQLECGVSCPGTGPCAPPPGGPGRPQPGTNCRPDDINCVCGLPFPHFILESGECIPSCGAAGSMDGRAAFSFGDGTCQSHGYAGQYDNVYPRDQLCCHSPLNQQGRSVRVTVNCGQGYRKEYRDVDEFYYDEYCVEDYSEDECDCPNPSSYCDNETRYCTGPGDCSSQGYQGQMSTECTDQDRNNVCIGNSAANACGTVCEGTLDDPRCE